MAITNVKIFGLKINNIIGKNIAVTKVRYVKNLKPLFSNLSPAATSKISPAIDDRAIIIPNKKVFLTVSEIIIGAMNATKESARVQIVMTSV
jgi:hypothetical protein